MHPEDTAGFRLVGQSDLNGFGDGMQVMPHGDTLYVGHFGPSGMGTSILDISAANQRVLLHRARALVRGRLEDYFAAGGDDEKRIGGEA